MSEHDDQIETQLRAWAGDLERQVATQEVGLQRERRWRWLVPAAALAAASLLVVAAVRLGGGDDDGAPVAAVGGDERVRVDYERLEYEQEAHLTCPDMAPREAAGSAVFEMWGDRENRRWRNLVTYPDGSTRELVVQGSPWYPTSGGQRGEVGLEGLGCGGHIGTVVAEPGQGSLVALNLRVEPPRLADGSPAVLRHTDVAEVVRGDFQDSEGRPAVLWRQVIDGSASGSFGDRPLTQTEEWFVDGPTGDVLEHTFEQRVEGLYIARWRLTATEIGQRDVPTGTFATDGLDPIEVFDPPWDDADSTPTTMVDSPDDLAVASRFTAMARSLDRGSVAAVGFGDPLRLAVGGEIVSAVPTWELPQEAAWRVEVTGYAAREGQASVLELIRSHPPSAIGVSLGRGGRCVTPDDPPAVEYDQVLSIQPTATDSCIQWYAVDLYVRAGRVVVVDLRFFEP